MTTAIKRTLTLKAVNYVRLQCEEIILFYFILSSNWRDTRIFSIVSGYYEEPSRVQST